MGLAIFLIFAHYIGDYVFQSNYLASTKKDNNYNLFVHSFLYSGTICAFYLMCGDFAVWKFIVLIILHFIQDRIKAQSKDEKKREGIYLYIDQALHIILDFLLLVL